MNALYYIIRKELKLLFRDKAGLSFLIVMPMALVLLMTALQDSTFKELENEKIRLIVVNYDQDILGQTLWQALDSSQIFILDSIASTDPQALHKAKAMVEAGQYKMGLYLPPKATTTLRRTISAEIKKQMNQGSAASKKTEIAPSEIEIFYDPVIKASFKQAVSGSIQQIIAHIQTQMVFKSYTKTIENITGKSNNDLYPIDKIQVKETATGHFANSPLPNSSQHNVPAWTVFAIFFIVIPLSGQIIAERTEGTLGRLRTFPTPIYIHFLGKILIYNSIALIQVLILFAVGRFAFGLIDLPVLPVPNLITLLVFTGVIGLASSSYAIAVGIFSKTQHQAAIFGSISVVILAAIGGVWIPIYIMSEKMQWISLLSPLRWALDGYYEIVLKHSNCMGLWPQFVLLTGFSALMLLMATIAYRGQKD